MKLFHYGNLTTCNLELPITWYASLGHTVLLPSEKLSKSLISPTLETSCSDTSSKVSCKFTLQMYFMTVITGTNREAVLRCIGVLLGKQDARCIQRPIDFIGQIAFQNSDGIIEPPQIPCLHIAVFSCCHQQVPERKREQIKSWYCHRWRYRYDISYINIVI